MKLRVYAVYDSKIGVFARPFFMQSKGEALRAWQDVVNDPNTSFHKHPEDFTLFEIGVWEDEDARFENHVSPESMGLALDYTKPKLQENNR